MRTTIEKNAQAGGSGPLTASEQMQPMYDVKAKLQEMQVQMQALQKTVQVSGEHGCDFTGGGGPMVVTTNGATGSLGGAIGSLGELLVQWYW